MKLSEYVLSLLFPPKCNSCAATVSSKDALCAKCLERYSTECSEAKNNSAASPDIYLTLYRPRRTNTSRITERLIYSQKHRRSKSLTDFFARDMSDKILKYLILHDIDRSRCLITYIPRSEHGLKKYGFDQSEDLARRISHYTGIPFAKTLVRLGGSEQKSLDAAGRALNAAASMTYFDKSEVRGKYAVIVDDVSTTGSSMSFASELLRDNGAADCITATIARTEFE